MQAVYTKNGVKLFEKPRTRGFLLLENLKTQKLSSAQLLWLAQFLGNQNQKLSMHFLKDKTTLASITHTQKKLCRLVGSLLHTI